MAVPALHAFHGNWLLTGGSRRTSIPSWSLALSRTRFRGEFRCVAATRAVVASILPGRGRGGKVLEPLEESDAEWSDEEEEDEDEDEEEVEKGENGKPLFKFSLNQAVEDDESEVDEDGEPEDEDEDDEQEVGGVESEDNKDELTIAKLGVAKEIVNALAERGITELFPIQRAVFKPAMDGLDVIARAKTGTGKTLAFGIPIMDRIYQERAKSRRTTSRGPVALVLAPTRELAKQVEQEFVESGKNLATVCVYGGVSIISQKRLLSRGVDIAVGTPGRIIDLLEQGCLDLKGVKFMVLDEADRMLAVGFEEDVERIMEELPASRQNMLFSATMPSWVQKLSRKFMNSPTNIDLIGEREEKLAEGIKLFAVQTSRAAKGKILSDIITVYGKGGKTIVFTETKRDAEEVCLAMNRSLGCESLHGDIAQFQREKTLNAFREGKFLILVATDVAARGLDITDVDLVIHYDLPRDPETFVHRSGRTGRAGKDGTALVLYAPEQKRSLKQIERDVGCTFQFTNVPPFEEVLKSSSSQAELMIKNVHPELQEVFLETAQRLLDEHGTSAFAAALAHMTGYSQPPPARSLITLEPGFLTLKLVRAGGKFPLATRHVVGAISDVHQKAADNLGKVQMIDERNVEGAVFDLPEDIAKELLSKPVPPGTTIEIVKELPSLQAGWDDSQRSPFGRRSFDNYRSSGGRYDSYRSDSGRSSNGSGGRSFNGRSSGYGSPRFGSQSGSPRFGSQSGSPRFGSQSGSPRFGSSRGGSWNNSESFAGTCYKCGKSGHRASECSQ